jgi:hypothetical protein
LQASWCQGLNMIPSKANTLTEQICRKNTSPSSPMKLLITCHKKGPEHNWPIMP